jgi:hypothetical protein
LEKVEFCEIYATEIFSSDEQDYTSRPIEQVKTNDTPSNSQQLLTITLPKDQTIDSIKNINGAIIINEIS